MSAPLIIRVIDTETVGLPPGPIDPVEIATVDVAAQPTDGGLVCTRGRMWATLLNPGGAIPPEAVTFLRVGKKRRPRLLDGREHNEFPQVGA